VHGRYISRGRPTAKLSCREACPVLPERLYFLASAVVLPAPARPGSVS
jgi:hypothetical protein